MGRKLGILRRLLSAFAILSLVFAGGIFGIFRPIDHTIQSFRFGQSQLVATGEIVFISIDAKSLRSVGVWPWPRQLHAQLVDSLVDMNASDIVFDIDFSSLSNETDDTLFAQALERAGGYVMLAGFRHTINEVADTTNFNLPIERFVRHADPVMVNVVTESDGVIRSYPYGVVLDDISYASVATALIGGKAPSNEFFSIDFGIDAGTIDHISYSEILDGTIDPARIENKQVVIGASALELRDTFTVPRYGIIPGALLQILAAETLKQGRNLTKVDIWIVILFAAAFAAAFSFTRYRYNLKIAVVATVFTALLVEVLALFLQLGPGFIIDTVAIHVAIASFAIAGLANELGIRRFLAYSALRERDATKSILDRVIADNFDGVVVIDSNGFILTASRLASEILDLGSDSVFAGLNIEAVLPLELSLEIKAAVTVSELSQSVPVVKETTITDSIGVDRTIEYVVTLSKIEDSIENEDIAQSTVACLTFRDITSRRANERRLNYLATYDPLTGALSRSKMVERINSSMASESGRDVGITILLLNLSRFKEINETLGHSIGDELLKQVVVRLSRCENDCVVRLGGDNFAIAVAGILSGDRLEFYSRDVLSKVSSVYQIDEHQAYVGARMGVTNTDLSGYDPEQLIAHADMALTVATDMPGKEYAVYEAEMDVRLKEARDMERELRSALVHEQLYLVYQPQIDLESGRTIGVEALVRWSHPELGQVSPAKFIPIAESTGLIIELGQWILEKACTEVANWPGDLKLAVNISPMQFEFGDVIDGVRRAIEISGIPTKQLDVEITEGVFIANREMITRDLLELKKMGIGVALDDFGTGYSSLSYLGQLPIDKIKIDQAFVRGLPGDQESAAIIRAVMTLSESLNKIVVAEGIENADQAWMLQLAGCHIGQGYHYGKPMAASEIIDRIYDEMGKFGTSAAG